MCISHQYHKLPQQRSSNIAGCVVVSFILMNVGRFIDITLLFSYFLPILFRNIGATAQEIKHIDFASIIIATGGALVGSAFADKGGWLLWLLISLCAKALTSWAAYDMAVGNDYLRWIVRHNNRCAVALNFTYIILTTCYSKDVLPSGVSMAPTLKVRRSPFPSSVSACPSSSRAWLMFIPQWFSALRLLWRTLPCKYYCLRSAIIIILGNVILVPTDVYWRRIQRAKGMAL